MTRYALVALAAFSLTLAGCEEVQQLLDNEMAQAEAAYLPFQVMATLGVGLEVAEDLSHAAEAILAGAPVGENECWTADIVADNQAGGGIVTFDFAHCYQRSGFVHVTVYPSPTTEPQMFVAGPTDLMFVDYAAQGMRLNGGISVDALDNEGTVTASLKSEYQVYEGQLEVTGPWTVISPDELRLDLAGTYASATGLDWTVAAAGVTVAYDCAGALSGELRSRFTNDAGMVEAIAAFDGSCDGCASTTVNGVPGEDVCVPESVAP